MLKLLENIGQLLFIQGDNRFCGPFAYGMVFQGTEYVFNIQSLDSNLFSFQVPTSQIVDENDNPFPSWIEIQDLLLKYMASENLQTVQILDGGVPVVPLTYSNLTEAQVQVKPIDNFSIGSLSALNSATQLNVFGNTSAVIEIRGTFTGTVSFQVTHNGIDYYPLFGVPTGSAPNTQSVSSTTTVGAWEFPVTGCYGIRAIMTAYSSGTATTRIRSNFQNAFVRNFNTGATTQPVSGTVTANIGTGSIGAGTNAIGDVGLQVRANATGAGSATVINCPATPVAQSIKATAGRILGFYVNNSSASLRWLKVFNNASPVLGTTSAVLDIPIPPSNNSQFIDLMSFGIGASTAIVIAITGAKGLTNNTVVTLDEVSGFVVFA